MTNFSRAGNFAATPSAPQTPSPFEIFALQCAKRLANAQLCDVVKTVVAAFENSEHRTACIEVARLLREDRTAEQRSLLPKAAQLIVDEGGFLTLNLSDDDLAEAYEATGIKRTPPAVPRRYSTPTIPDKESWRKLWPHKFAPALAAPKPATAATVETDQTAATAQTAATEPIAPATSHAKKKVPKKAPKKAAKSRKRPRKRQRKSPQSRKREWAPKNKSLGPSHRQPSSPAQCPPAAARSNRTASTCKKGITYTKAV